MDELEKTPGSTGKMIIFKENMHWQEIVVKTNLQELNREYEEKNRTGICTFY